MPSLSLTAAGSQQYPRASLIAESQAGYLRNPLETGECRGVAEARVGGDAFQQCAGHDRLGVDPLDRRPVASSTFSYPPGQQGPTSSPVSIR